MAHLNSLMNLLPGWAALAFWCSLFVPHAAYPATGATLEDYLKNQGYEEVEFERTEHPQDFVIAYLNGRKHTFLVDTGWGMTTLSKSAARESKSINQTAPKPIEPPLASANSAEVFVMDKLTLGHVQLFNQAARVEDLRADYVQLPFAGILGFDFLWRNFCLIDCYKHRLYVHKAKPSEEQTSALDETLRRSGFTEVPLDSRFLLTLQANLNGMEVRLALDTGAACDEIDDSELTRLGLTTVRSDRAPTGSLIPQDLNAPVSGVGSIGRHELKATKVSSFRLGPRNWKNVYFGVADLKPWGLAKPGTDGEGVKGLLCQPTLARAGALIDIARQKLWLRPEKPAH
jgi:predicted aspartyl protease